MPPKWGPGKGEVFRGDEPVAPEPGPQFAGSKTRHGTQSGFSKHISEGEEACEPCRAAKAAYDYRQMGVPENILRNRIGAKAQSFALQILRRRHDDEYWELYQTLVDGMLKENGLERKQKQRRKTYEDKG